MSERLKRLGRHKELSDILTEIMESREDKSLEFITIVTKKPVEVYKYIKIGGILVGIAEV